MELDFPENPILNQIWIDPSNDVPYTWDGQYWTIFEVKVNTLPSLPDK